MLFICFFWPLTAGKTFQAQDSNFEFLPPFYHQPALCPRERVRRVFVLGLNTADRRSLTHFDEFTVLFNVLGKLGPLLPDVVPPPVHNSKPLCPFGTEPLEGCDRLSLVWQSLLIFNLPKGREQPSTATAIVNCYRTADNITESNHKIIFPA